jgi:hypothetical protein
MTPFGGSQGLLWNWSGPEGFTSTIQNPRTDTAWGTYELIVTEKRNGCTDTAFKPLSMSDFGVLAARSLNLHGYYQNPSVILNWQDIGTDAIDHFEIERSSDGATFNAIGDVQSNAAGDSILYFYSYTDRSPLSGNNFYRLKLIGKNGSISYSIVAFIKADPTAGKIYLTNTGKGQYMIFCQSDKNQTGALVVYDLLGQRLATANVQVSQGMNTINVPGNASTRNSIAVVVLYLDGKLSFTQEMIP